MKRYLLYLIALVCWPLAIFGGTHHLKVVIEPHGAQYGSSILIINANGSMEFVGEDEGDIPEGKTVRIYPMSGLEGYTVKEWKENGTIISLNTQTSEWGEIYADYIMPGKDVVLTAVFSNGSDNPDNPHNPDNPDNPDNLDNPDNPPVPVTYQFSVSVKDNLGTIGKLYHTKNGRNYVLMAETENELSEGDTVHIYAQQDNSEWRLVQWKENEVVKELQFTYDPVRVDRLQFEGYHEYVMPGYDVSLVAYFEQSVPSPANPGVNQIVDGILVLNDFKPGGLSAVMPHDKTSFNSIVVIGDMREKDLSIASGTKATTLDLTRTYGFHTIPGKAFSSNTTLTLEHILLPSCIDSIASAAFDLCTNLKQLTILATTPPTLSYTALGSLASGLTVKVPAASLALYKAAEEWKGLKIEAISDEVSDLTLMLPADYTDGRYKNMSVELVNANTGATSKYIVTDSQSYTFRTLVPNTRYTAYLKSSDGQVLSTISNIFIDGGNKTLTFANVRTLQDVTLTVKTPDEKDVTSDVEITWMDASGRFLCKGNTVDDVLQGITLKYSIKLSDELAQQYAVPDVKKFTVNGISNHVTFYLESIPTAYARGIVCSGGFYLENASVRLMHTVNGKYTTITETTTDRYGEYGVTVPNVPTTITVGANGYMVQSIQRDDFSDYGQVDFFRLEPAAPPSLTISYAFGMTVDLANITFTVYNTTKNQEITEFINSYPQLLIYEDVTEGDNLAITATSLTKSFSPVTVDLTVSGDGQQSITFPLKQLGGIDATFASTLNASVVGILYDSKQQYLRTERYEEALLSIRDLPDGEYTLVSMKESDRYNSIQSLGQYEELGLTEGVDFVKNVVEVVSGTVSTVENEEIPASSLGDAVYTNTDATYFAAGETTSAIGCFVTLRSKIAFNTSYADGVSNSKLVVDIPDGCEFVENSVIVGTTPIPYTYKEGRLSVTLNATDEMVKFCILPNTEGTYRIGGNAQFKYDGKLITEPMGTAVFDVKANEDMAFIVPPIINEDSFYASGTTSVGSTVKIFVDGELNAQTTANAYGNWSTKCQLNNPANLSSHQVQAIVETPSGATASSDVKTIQYDKNGIVVESVTMSHYNPEMGKTYEVVFGFNESSSSSPSYTVYYPQPDFTFSVKLNTEDEKKVSNMALYTTTMRGNTVVLHPVFDPTTKTWVASHTYEPLSCNIDPPVNVSVDFDAVAQGEVDREALDEVANFFNDFQEKVRQGMEEIDTIYDDYMTMLQRGNASQEELDAAVRRLWDCIGIDFSLKDDDVQMTDDELEAAIDSLLGENWQQEYDSLMNSYNDFVNGSLYGTYGATTITRCTGLTEASLLEQGYKKIMATDSTFVYLLTTENECALVDFVNDKYLRIDLTALNPDVAAQVRRIIRRGEGLDLFFWLDQLNIINAFSSAYDSLCRTLDNTCIAVSKLLTENQKAIKKFEKLPLHKRLLSMAKGRYLYKMSKGLRFADWFLNGVFKSFVKGTDIANAGKALEKAPMWAQWAGSLFKSGLSVYALFMDEKNAVDQLFQVGDLYKRIPNPCKDDQSAADALRHRVNDMGVFFAIYHVTTIGTDIECCLASIAALPAFETPAFFLSVAQTCIDVFAFFNVVVINPFMNNEFFERKASCELELSLLECNKEKRKEKNPKFKSNSRNAKVLIDPSGYVYEGVTSNRLEGVMTTIYCKQEVEDVYGDKHEETVLWDAENYDQQNPLYTDKDGRYEWYVPEGSWQVKYEKDGYQTAFSEWLPVPPPQLDVNQAMIQASQPEVTMAHCYPTGIEVDFSKYMKPSTLNNENIFLTHGGKKVSGKVVMLNEEMDLKGNKYASKARFVIDENIPVGEKVQFTVSHKVKSYADVMMANDFSQEFTIEHEISEIVADSLVRIIYGEEQSLIVTATPAEAAAGKTLQVASGTAMIATTDKEEYVLDKNGQAEVKIKGLVPGSTALLFSIKEYSASAMTYVEVLDPNKNLVAEPKASIASGSEVTKGQQIMLTCETPGAQIYYTLDGSCPCNDTPSRQTYNGPITIADNVTVIKAMAAAKNLGESDVATFTYHLHGYSGIEDLSSSVNIYPLVTRSNVNVDLDGQKAKSVSVMNVGGVCIFNATNVSEHITIDFTTQPAGLYIIVVQLNNGKVVKKIVKK